MKLNHRIVLGLTLLIISLSTGCGGGGGSSTPPTPQPIPSPSPYGLNVVPVINDLPLSFQDSLGDLTGRNVYTIYSVMNGAEGIKGDVSGSDVEITLTAALGSLPAATKDPYKIITPKQRTLSRNGLRDPGQIRQDRKMREAESLALQNRRSIYSKNISRPRSELAVVNDIVHFYVDRGSSETPAYVDVTATCVAVRANCYIFIDNRASRTILTAAFVDQIADFFNDTVYPVNRATFGQDTDTDGEPPVFILFSRLPSSSTWRVMGYFWAGDKYPDEIYSYSNEHDMFYLTIPTYTSDLELFRSILAHEFQHMINFDRHLANGDPVGEQLWLNEALSELADYICTGNNERRRSEITDYLSGPASLTLWNYDDTRLLNYASSRLFGLYLYDRFWRTGNTNLMLNLVNSTSHGIQNVTTQTGVSFDTIFRDWCAALYISGNGWTADPRWQYQSIDLHANGSNGLLVYYDWGTGYSYTGSNRLPYTPYIYSISGLSPTSTITITGESGAAGGVIIAP